MTAVRSLRGGDYINVKDHGLVGDGSTNDTTAFNTIVAATSTGTLYFPPGTYKLATTAAVNQPALHMLGDGATLSPTSAPGMITVSALREFTGFTLPTMKLLFPSTWSGPLDIHDNDFSGSTGGYGSGTLYFTANTSTGAMPSEITIRENTFTGHSWAIHGCLSNSTITRNVFSGSTSRNIEFFCGSGLRVTENYITGGVTAIKWLTDRVFAGNYASIGNVITGNIVSGISEENIGTDEQGNVLASGGNVQHGTISSSLALSGGFLSFVPSFSLSVADAYLNLYVVMLNGKAKGKHSKVTSQGAGGTTNLTTTETNLAGYTVGDAFALVVANINFTINDNQITGGQVGIDHWGCTYGTEISGNHISACSAAGVRITSLYGVPTQAGGVGPAYTGPGFYAPCNNVQIHENTVHDCDISCTTGGPATPDITSIGNRVFHNNLLGASKITYNVQEAYQVWDNQQRDHFPPTYSATTGFESGTVASNFDTVVDAGGRMSLDNAVFNGGAQSLKIVNGGTAYGSYTPPAGVRRLSIRFALNADTLPASGSPGIFRVDVGASTSVGSLSLFSTGSIHYNLGTGAVSQTVGTITAATWYWVDLVLDITTSTFTAQIKLTNIATGIVLTAPASFSSTGETPADITDIRYGTSSALLGTTHFDDIWDTNSATWPLLPSAQVVPTDGSWALGEKVYQPVPVSGGTEGYICTTAGNPGTWKAFGVIA